MGLAEMSEVDINEGYQSVRAVSAVNQLILRLAEAGISSQLSRSMRRLQAKLEGERGHEWIEIKVTCLDLDVSYERGDDGQRVLWVGQSFADLLGERPADKNTVKEAISSLVFYGCMCADGNRKQAGKRQQEFLEKNDQFLNILNLFPWI